MEEQQQVLLNGQQVSKAKLEEEKRKAEETKGKKIVEVAPGQYRTKLED